MIVKYLTGYIIILSFYLFSKGCDYNSSVKTYGIVVSEKDTWFGSGRYRSHVYYPIAKFTGPSHVVTSEHNLYTRDGKDSIITSYINTTEYLTTDPRGGYYLSKLPMGTRVKIIYEEGFVSEATVYTIFSYWLKIPTICILLVLCFIWTGVTTFAFIVKAQKQE